MLKEARRAGGLIESVRSGPDEPPPAVLLTARAEDVPGRPRSWTLAGKTVRHRLDAAEAPL